MPSCIVAGCASGVHGYSTLCTRHKKANVRHGHPEQRPVRAHELAPYVRVVHTRRAANAANPAWAILRERWDRVVERSSHVLEAQAAGRVGVRKLIRAAECIQAVAATVPPDSVVDTALALYLLADVRPGRFRSDRAQAAQLVRRVRMLAPTACGSFWCPKAKKTRAVYRDLPPRVVEVLASQLTEAFGLAGLQLADAERNRRDPEEVERERLAFAIESLR